MTKPKTYTANSFNALQPSEKWVAYEALLNYANELAKLTSKKKVVIEEKTNKIDYLKLAKEALQEQLQRRNQAGAIARRDAYEERRVAVIAIYLELSDSYSSVTAPMVHKEFKNRYRLDKLSVRTVREYLKDYHQTQQA